MTLKDYQKRAKDLLSSGRKLDLEKPIGLRYAVPNVNAMTLASIKQLDGRKKASPPITRFPTRKLYEPKNSAVRMIIESFERDNYTTHSGMGLLLPFVIDYCHANKIPYELSWAPGGFNLQRFVLCRRCRQPIKPTEQNDAKDIFEHMHWKCFHIEFEHSHLDPGTEETAICSDENCPNRPKESKK